MADHDPQAYGRHVAADYDALYSDLPGTADAVGLLAELAGAGPVLELGIGTGRLALPLAERGLEVHGIDGSEEMLALLRNKPGGAGMALKAGDFADTRMEGSFSLVVLAINTIFALPTQDAQVRCFQNAARHLGEGGVFVIEAYVLDPRTAVGRPVLTPRFITAERVELQVARYDPVAQTMARTLVHLHEAGVRLVPANDRYASPAELDLMARLAGLCLRHRFGGWREEPFASSSDSHVSVYEREG